MLIRARTKPICRLGQITPAQGINGCICQQALTAASMHETGSSFPSASLRKTTGAAHCLEMWYVTTTNGGVNECIYQATGTGGPSRYWGSRSAESRPQRTARPLRRLVQEPTRAHALPTLLHARDRSRAWCSRLLNFGSAGCGGLVS